MSNSNSTTIPFPQLTPEPNPLPARPPSWWRKTFAALGVRNYRLFYIGQGLSLVGTWMRRTAMGWLVYSITGSTALLGTVLALTNLPMFLLSPLAGSIADRANKRRMIIWTQIILAVVSAILALIVWGHASGRWHAKLWHLMLLALLGGTAFAFEVPSRQAFMVEMVGREHLMNAIALNSALVNVTRMIGPAFAGIVMAAVGMATCFVIDSVTYLIVVLTLVTMVLPPFRPPQKTSNHVEHLIEGIREVRRNRPVLLILILLSINVTLGWGFQVLLPAIVRDVLKMGELGYGILSSMFGAGAIFGALYSAGLPADATSRRGPLFGGIWIMAAGLLLFSLTRNPWVIAAGLVISGFGGVLFLATGNTLVQTSVDDSIRGRVMGLWAVSFGGSMPLGAFAAGFAAEWLPDIKGFPSEFLTVMFFAVILLVTGVIAWRKFPREIAQPVKVPANPA